MAHVAGAKDSNLGRVADGYDFVVASTQASLNSGLKEFLAEDTQPVTNVCFIMDDDWKIIEHLTLEEFKQRSDGIDPFSIAHDTDWDDDRVQKVFKTGFSVGVRLRMGLPPNVPPRDVPDIIELLRDASNITFRLMCSELIIVACTPGRRGGGKWEIFNQRNRVDGQNQMWYFETSVNMVRADLAKTLDTPYYNAHPLERDMILRQLENLSGTAFSLHQLLFDLDRTVVQRMPVIKGLEPGQPAYDALSSHFKDYYVALAKEHGWPLLGITAVAQKADPSQLILTDYERRVNINSTPAASTLDNVCVTNGRRLPAAYDFDWDWVDSSQVSQISGVIAINRSSAVSFFIDQIEHAVRDVCLDFSIDARHRNSQFHVDIETLQPRPLVSKTVYGSGARIADFSYQVFRRNGSGVGTRFIMCDIEQRYHGTVSFVPDGIEVEQSAVIHVAVKTQNMEEQGNMCDRMVRHRYNLSVDAGGSLRFQRFILQDRDSSQSPDRFLKFRGNIAAQVAYQLVMVARMAGLYLDDNVFSPAPALVFPGSKVFTYTNALFSNSQDLTCGLTYLSPSQSGTKGALAEARGLNIAHSTELMENHVYGELVSPGGNFEALQTSNENGHALVFFIDSKNALSVFQECSSTTTTGWRVSDLSTPQLMTYLAEDETAIMRHFGVSQSSLDSTVGMAMAIDSRGADSLCVSLGNSASDLSWIQSPSWTTVPFDADDPSDGLRIAKIIFSETYDKVQYLIVDVSTGSSSHGIMRYHIDASKSTGKAWVKHDVPIDLQPGQYKSCVGRRRNGYVDGIYTAGNINGAPQLIYQPIINVFGDGPPTVTRLAVPDGVVPTAIAAVRNTDLAHDLYESTDLYMLAGTKLYRYPADKQTNDAVGELVVEDEIFQGTAKLEAMQVDGVVTLWGRNAAQEVYYVSCYTDEVEDPNSWSYPVPILDRVQHLSAYVNRVDGGNTIFAYGDGAFTRLTQATNTETKEWKPQDIRLENTPKQDMHSFMSYTTTIHLTGQDGQPVPDTMLSLWANSHTPAYVNGKYYVLGVKEVRVPTDDSGAITVVEATEDVQGSILSVCVPNDTLTTVIDPMRKGFAKMSALDDPSRLRQARYAANTVAGGVVDDATSPLVDPATDNHDLEQVGQSIRHFKEVHQQVRPPATTTRLFYRDDAPRVVRRGRPVGNGPDGTVWNPFTAIGDLWRKLKKAVKKVIKVIKDAVTGALEFIAEIGGKVYRSVVKAVNAIMGAIEWLFNAIKTVVMAVVRFIQFLFNWNDIKRTKQVLHNVTKQYLAYQVSQIDAARIGFGERIEATADKLREWGGINDWSRLGDAAALPPSGSGHDPSSDHDSGSLLLANHFRSQMHRLEVQDGLPDNSNSEASGLITVLLDAVSAQGAVLSAIYDQLQDLAKDFKSLGVGEVIKRIAAILGVAMLSSVKVVVDALFRVLASLAGSALDILDTRLRIPIISDILNAIGVPDISFLDLFCWIAAVGYTVVYKVINNRAPFPDSGDVRAIISATSWKDLKAVFHRQTAGMNGDTASKRAADKDPLALTDLEKAMHASGHGVSSFLMFAISFLSSFEALYAESGNPLSAPAGVMRLIIAGLQAGASAIASRYPVEDDIINVIATGVTVAKISSGLAFWGPVRKQLEARNSGFKGLIDGDGRGTSAILDVIIIFPELVVTGWHFYELAQKPASQERSAAIIGEVTNLSGYISRVSYAVAVNSRDPVTKPVAVAVMAGATIIGSALQAARATQVN